MRQAASLSHALEIIAVQGSAALPVYYRPATVTISRIADCASDVRGSSGSTRSARNCWAARKTSTTSSTTPQRMPGRPLAAPPCATPARRSAVVREGVMVARKARTGRFLGCSGTPPISRASTAATCLPAASSDAPDRPRSRPLARPIRPPAGLVRSLGVRNWSRSRPRERQPTGTMCTAC